MATITGGLDREYLELYRGFSEQNVGPGTDPGMYASDAYARRKVRKLYLGGLSTILYAGMEHDMNPLVLPFRHEPQYNTIMAFNLNYLPIPLRKNVLRFVLESNQNRIRSQQPIIVSYDAVKRAVPQVEGCVRRYKLQLINVRETHPVIDWGQIIQDSGTRWQNHYRRTTT